MALGITAIAQDAIASLGTPTTVVSLTGLQVTANAGNITQTNSGSVQLTGVQAPMVTGQIQVDPDNTYGADGSDVNVQVSGSSNTFTLDLATTAMASNTDIDFIVNGDGNVFDFEINYDGATNYVDVDGDSNTVNFEGSGYAGGYFYLDQTGDSRTFDIQQLSTLNNDWLKIISNGSNGSVCIIQDDNGTAVGC